MRGGGGVGGGGGGGGYLRDLRDGGMQCILVGQHLPHEILLAWNTFTES